MPRAAKAKSKKQAEKQPPLSLLGAHPLRIRIWIALVDRVLSPNRLKELLGAEMSAVAYHVKVLAEFGYLELVKTRQVRGSTEHFYRAIQRPTVDDEEYSKMSIAERENFMRRICELAYADMELAFTGHSFSSRPDHVVARVPFQVDEEGWGEMAALHRRYLEECFEIKARSDERRIGDPSSPTIPGVAFGAFWGMPSAEVTAPMA